MLRRWLHALRLSLLLDVWFDMVDFVADVHKLHALTTFLVDQILEMFVGHILFSIVTTLSQSAHPPKHGVDTPNVCKHKLHWLHALRRWLLCAAGSMLCAAGCMLCAAGCMLWDSLSLLLVDVLFNMIDLHISIITVAVTVTVTVTILIS